ncbi:MAG: ROK family protein [Acidobacteria bacterium]|nr:ROK family protein [Acidobacteriota bacterium]
MSEKVLVGVDVGGTKTAVLLSMCLPDVLARKEFPTLPAEGPERAIEMIKAGIHEILTGQRLTEADIQGIGVSCGGPLDRVAGVIQSPPNLPTWTDVPITSILEKEFHTGCQLENDANAGAVAENRFGAGQGFRNMVFLTMGTGLGAGIILDGHLYHGTTDLAGEIGHVRLTRRGPIGYNKAGSVEGWASGGGMAQVALRAVELAQKRGKKTLLAEHLQTHQAITARDVGIAAQQGDALAKQIIQSTGRRLGEALAILVDILNPEVIVIGGLAMRLGESLLAPARAVVKRESLAAEVCQIVPAALGEKIGDIAALCVATGL